MRTPRWSTRTLRPPDRGTARRAPGQISVRTPQAQARPRPARPDAAARDLDAHPSSKTNDARATTRGRVPSPAQTPAAGGCSACAAAGWGAGLSHVQGALRPAYAPGTAG